MPLAPLKPLLRGGWEKLTTVKSAEWHTLAEARLRLFIL
jgi:hypothetical protein